MREIADGYFQFEERLQPSGDVFMNMRIDLIDGEELDTANSLHGKFTIAGSQRKEFSRKLGALIDEYRI